MEQFESAVDITMILHEFIKDTLKLNIFDGTKRKRWWGSFCLHFETASVQSCAMHLLHGYLNQLHHSHQVVAGESSASGAFSASSESDEFKIIFLNSQSVTYSSCFVAF